MSTGSAWTPAASCGRTSEDDKATFTAAPPDHYAPREHRRRSTIVAVVVVSAAQEATATLSAGHSTTQCTDRALPSLCHAPALVADERARKRHAIDTASPVPHKDFSDLYEEMSGKGASASEAHRMDCRTFCLNFSSSSFIVCAALLLRGSPGLGSTNKN